MQRIKIDVWDPVADGIEEMARESGVSAHRIVSDALAQWVGLDRLLAPEPPVDHPLPWRTGPGERG